MSTFLRGTGLLTLLLLSSLKALQGQAVLDPRTQPQFVNALPLPPVMDARGGGKYTITVTQFEQELGLIDPANAGKRLKTKVWGYNGSYPGPTILAQKDVPVEVTWENELVKNGQPLPHLLPVDRTVHWAYSEDETLEKHGIPLVTHLHGGHTESASDGLPDAWFTPRFSHTGPTFKKRTLRYDNDQEAATLWYHDHAMGITRLNVYAGLAGYYLITDQNEKDLQQQNKLPAGDYDIALAIQDKMFTTDGQLYYPSLPEFQGAPEPSVLPEFFGDFILVNGAVWPVLEVEPRPYRFRLLNGSDSRYYNLFFTSNLDLVQIASDNGLLPAPAPFKQLLLGTGERKDVVIDFSAVAGQTLVLRNNAKTPFPMGTAVNPQTTGRIMAFKVTKPLGSTPKAVLPVRLRPSIERLQATDAGKARQLILFESTDEYGRLKPMLGTVEKGVLHYHDPITENPMLNSTEVWEIYNETMDAHTIHLHMVHMQLISRQKFKASVDMETGQPGKIRMVGNPKPPGPDEAGWKDTYIMYPGEVTRVIASFDLPGLYSWHCHILSHEDHEMMRPYLVGNGSDMVMDDVKDALAALEKWLQLRTLPNPFTGHLTLSFVLPKLSKVVINVYDSKGSLVQQLYNGKSGAGLQLHSIDGSRWSSGTYFLEVIIDNHRLMRKIILQK